MCPINLFPEDGSSGSGNRQTEGDWERAGHSSHWGVPGQGDGEGKAGKLVPETQYEKNIIVTNWIQEVNTMNLLTLLARTKRYRAVTNNH